MKRINFGLLFKTAFTALSAAFLLIQAAPANAQCGGSFEEMGAQAAVVQKSAQIELISKMSGRTEGISILKGEYDDDDAGSIVGLWHVDFNIAPPGAPGPVTIQTAFQIWNLGGTEVHNPKVDPRTGPVCLGAWKQYRGSYNLVHRVWSYDPNGTFLGTINLSESVRVSKTGRKHTGTFTLDFFDPDGNPLEVPGVHPAHVEGVVVGERISPN
jgi:hypothetical protein